MISIAMSWICLVCSSLVLPTISQDGTTMMRRMLPGLCKYQNHLGRTVTLCFRLIDEDFWPTSKINVTPIPCLHCHTNEAIIIVTVNFARITLAKNLINKLNLPSVDQGFDDNDIPMDVMWLDIEHTDSKKWVESYLWLHLYCLPDVLCSLLYWACKMLSLLRPLFWYSTLMLVHGKVSPSYYPWLLSSYNKPIL